MSDNNEKSSKSRKISSKAPAQIVNFFSKPLAPNDVPSSSTASSTRSSHDRKRKIADNNPSSENEDLSTYAQTLQKNAEKISKIKKAKKVGTLVSTFFQQENNDGLSDFESPNKRMQIKTPPVIPKKKVTRKRKQPAKASKNKNALETEIFEKVLYHHSVADGLNSDDLQMALALSRSVADTQGEISDNISGVIRNAEPTNKEDIIRNTFRKFGFKKRDNNDYDVKDFFTNVAINKKWISKFTPLTRRSETMQKEKFKKKVKNILQISECFENLDGETMQDYHVTSSYLLPFFVPKSPTYNVSSTITETNIEAFYVNSLVPISTLPCGSMLKYWGDIPGRDISPQRDPLPEYNFDDTEISTQTLIEQVIERSSFISVEAKQRDVIDNGSLISCHTVNVLESNSDTKTVDDLSDNVDETTESSKFREDDEFVESVNIINSEHTNAAIASNECHIPSFIATTSDAEVIAKIEESRARQQSPDMFAEFESSANNSFSDDRFTTDNPQNESDQIISTGYLGSQLVYDEVKLTDPTDDHLSTSKEYITPTNVLHDGAQLIDRAHSVENRVADDDSNILIDLNSSKSGDLEAECVISQIGITNNEGHEIEAKADEVLESGSPVSQHKVKRVIELSSDDSNQSCVDKSEPSSGTHQQKSSSITSITSVAKHLSFTERLELYNNDPALWDMDNGPICSHISQSSQDSIVISDDEVNYSLSHGKVLPAFNVTKLNMSTMHSQESIEISDSEEEHIEIDSELPEGLIEERESFLSINEENHIEIDSKSPEGQIEERESFLSINASNDSEKSLDIIFDDEIFNSNHSLNDEDLINLSIKEMCQKEFVTGSVKSSATKNFSRTFSDRTFERKNVKSTPKTPEKFSRFEDDELDEFDIMVRGLRTPNTSRSIQIRDDDRDRLLIGQQDNICDDSVKLGSPPSPTNEFLVQSMDQLYEVRTGVLVTPKPDYENMDSPTRLEHLKKYGLKTLTKRKAVICLEHIYNRLHPFIELDGHDDLDDILSQKKVNVLDSGKRIVDIGGSQSNGLPNSIASQPRKDDGVVCIAENHFDILQEHEEVFYLPSVPRAKKPWCLLPLHIAWYNLINSNSTLNDHILQYKPVDITEIRSLFKSIDLRYETNDIISFLDRKCITFKTENKRNNAVKKKFV